MVISIVKSRGVSSFLLGTPLFMGLLTSVKSAENYAEAGTTLYGFTHQGKKMTLYMYIYIYMYKYIYIHIQM